MKSKKKEEWSTLLTGEGSRKGIPPQKG